MVFFCGKILTHITYFILVKSETKSVQVAQCIACKTSTAFKFLSYWFKFKQKMQNNFFKYTCTCVSFIAETQVAPLSLLISYLYYWKRKLIGKDRTRLGWHLIIKVFLLPGNLTPFAHSLTGLSTPLQSVGALETMGGGGGFFSIFWARACTHSVHRRCQVHYLLCSLLRSGLLHSHHRDNACLL